MRYVLNSENLLSEVDSEWDQFAIDNGAPELAGGSVLGQSVWRFVSGVETVELYRSILRRVRSGNAVEFSVRCDSPRLRRRLAVGLSSSPGLRVEVVTKEIWEEAREEVSLPETATVTGGDAVSVCSWCERVRVGDEEWLAIELAVERMGLFSGAPIPSFLITHGVCPECDRRVRKEAGLPQA